MKKCPKLSKTQKEELEKIISDGKSSGREVRRIQAILMLNEDTDIQMIISLTKYSRRQIFDLRKNYLKNGLESVKDKRKGKPRELLTKKEREEILDIVKMKSPREYKYESDYWTTTMLGYFIEEEYDVKFKSKTSIYLLFKQAKFTYHKPGRIYEKHDPKEVKQWKKEAKPKVEKAWKDDNTIILCEDEMVLSTQTTFQKIWLPKGEYPKIEVSNTKKNKSLYGFLNVKTGQEHAFKTERQNMYTTVDVLKKVRGAYPTQNLLILWDGAGWHRGSEVRKYIESDKKIKTIYFPRYSPEENPQEHVWKNGRSNITHNKFIQDIESATDEFVEFLKNTNFKYSLLGFCADS